MGKEKNGGWIGGNEKGQT